jgi:DNA-3-methyladenine glycosylase II
MRKAIQYLKRNDPILGSIIEKVGPYRIEYSPPEFATLARSILYQQLSGKVALTLYNRLEAACPGKQVTPHAVLALEPERMRELGLSRQKIAYLREAAQWAIDGRLDFEELEVLPDKEVMRRLTAIKGIGPWTVHMFLIFGLRRPDVMPSGDLGIRVAVQKAYGMSELPPPALIDRMAEQRWRPYCSVASWYLWRSLEDKNGL